MIAAAVDSVTSEWIRNESDALAVRNGCHMDEERGEEAVAWIEDYCRLYEGEKAGQQFLLLPWQRDVTIRMFGWVVYSEEWGREVRRFRRASIWVPKKNGKSPLLAAWGLYLLMGDGEQGQKVYAVAKDGGQAMISFKHAMTMVEMSPELMNECELKKGGREGPRIIHTPSRSIYRIVSGDNPNSQEGLNGSVMVDETHVVDRKLMRILHGAGISRSEPFQIEVSTSGNNPDGYGKTQFDYGVKVERGEIEDQSFFYQSFAADQNVPDAELESRLEELGREANPSWGAIVKPAEFAAAYHRSKTSPAELLDFKMYRLNVWQSSSNPFLPAGAWELCRDNFTEDDLAGHECYLGLDLSLRWDTTALVALFQWEDEYRLLTKFWLPEETARKQRELVSWHKWQQAGAITLTSGNTTDFPLIKREILAWNEKFTVVQLSYDERFAQTMCQELQDEHGMSVAVCKQTPAALGGPMDMLSSLVVSRKLRHNGNPVMTWQAGNLSFKESNGAKRPVKPEGGLHLKIDGCSATIFALAARMFSGESNQSVYEREQRGFVEIG